MTEKAFAVALKKKKKFQQISPRYVDPILLRLVAAAGQHSREKALVWRGPAASILYSEEKYKICVFYLLCKLMYLCAPNSAASARYTTTYSHHRTYRYIRGPPNPEESLFMYNYNLTIFGTSKTVSLYGGSPEPCMVLYTRALYTCLWHELWRSGAKSGAIALALSLVLAL